MATKTGSLSENVFHAIMSNTTLFLHHVRLVYSLVVFSITFTVSPQTLSNKPKGEKGGREGQGV